MRTNESFYERIEDSHHGEVSEIFFKMQQRTKNNLAVAMFSLIKYLIKEVTKKTNGNHCRIYRTVRKTFFLECEIHMRGKSLKNIEIEKTNQISIEIEEWILISKNM